jgi:ABC-type glycerol-3-phosphate transport system substrate-binding protein
MCFYFRWDVLQDLGYTEATIPDTLDEWIEAMRKLKQKYPDAIPYTSMDNLHWSEFVFSCYGVTGRGTAWQEYFGKAIHSFEHPLIKDALSSY